MKNSKLLIGVLITFIGAILFFNNKINNSSPSKQTDTYAVSNTNSTSSSAIGDTATDFQVTTLDSDVFRLADKKGGTVILFGVAGWCGECIPEGKALTQVKKDYTQKGVEIIGVAFTKGDNNELLKQYKQVGGIDISLALDTDNVAGKYQITRLETTYIINKDGVIVYKDEGFTSFEDYQKELDQLL